MSATVDDLWPKINTRRVPLETAKTLVAEAGKFLEAQQRGMESLRARLLDVARQATTLATVLGGLLIAAIGGRAELPTWTYVSAATAFLFWLVTAALAVSSMLPREWFYAGRVPRDWWRAELIEDSDQEAEPALLAMARSSNEAIERNEKRQNRMVRWLRVTLTAHVSAAPVATLAGAATVQPLWTGVFLAFVFACGVALVDIFRRRP